MRVPRLCLGVLFLALAVSGRAADAPAVPALRLVPAPADLVVQVPQPRKLWDSLYNLDYVRKGLDFAPVKELIDGTQARRLRQLIAYAEKRLGVSHEELMDRLGGKGAVLAVDGLGDKAAVVMVLEGTDEKLVGRFFALAREVLEQELDRQGARGILKTSERDGAQLIRVGDNVHAARVGAALMIANNGKLLDGAVDLALGKGGKNLADNDGIKEAARILPKAPLATLWLNMDPVRKNPGADAFFKTPRDPFLTVVLGGWADVGSRSAFVCAGLHKEDDGLLVTLRMPKGREGMGADRELNAAPDGEPGTRPLLEPRGVLFSGSIYFDLGRFWTDRRRLFGDQIAKSFEQADMDTAKYLSSLRLSKVLTGVGPYHRFVVTGAPEPAYKRKPPTPSSAFALVTEMRNPDEFARTMEIVLRGGALLATPTVGIKYGEEKCDGCTIVVYRFNEQRDAEFDPLGFRFNYTPSFVRVGKHFVVASNVELARELVRTLKEEDKTGGKGATASSRYRVYPGGVIGELKRTEDQILAATVLSQAVPPDEARQQFSDLVALVNYFEGLTFSTTYGPTWFAHDIRLTFKK